MLNLEFRFHTHQIATVVICDTLEQAFALIRREEQVSPEGFAFQITSENWIRATGTCNANRASKSESLSQAQSESHDD